MLTVNDSHNIIWCDLLSSSLPRCMHFDSWRSVLSDIAPPDLLTSDDFGNVPPLRFTLSSSTAYAPMATSSRLECKSSRRSLRRYTRA